MAILIKNGQIVNEGSIKRADLLIEQGRIVKIERSIFSVIASGSA